MTTLSARGADGTWTSWFGVQVTGAVDLPLTAGYADQAPAARAGSAHQQDVGYLLRQLAPQPGFALEARWLAGNGRLEMFLLGRVTGPTEAAARGAAERAAEQVGDLPSHVTGARITGDGDLHRALVPFAPHPAGLVEVRRGVATGQPTRADAQVRYYAAVLPFRSAPERMPALLERLAGAGSPVMLTVGLEPAPVPAGLPVALADIAERYAHLARAGESVGTGLFGSVRQPLAPEPFAAAAEPLFRDAARRLRGVAFRMRVTVAGQQPVGDGLARAVGEAIGSPGLTGAATPYTLHRPRTAAEHGWWASVLAGLGVPPRVAGEDPLPPVLAHVAQLADAQEAAAAFWLPASADGSLPGFPTVPPPADRDAARTRTVYGEGATHNEFQAPVTVSGDFVARDKHAAPDRPPG